MKKQLFTLPLILLGLASCTSKPTADHSSLNIIAPQGAPAFAFYNYAQNEHFETNSVPSNIVAMMNEQSNKDVVVIDTVTGVKAINNGAPYKLAANISFGNFYICSTGNDEDGVLNEGDKICLFGQNQTPDKIWHYIYGSEHDENIEWVAAAGDAGKVLAAGKNQITGTTIDYVFLAQPAVHTILNNTNAATYGKAAIYANVQDLYAQKSEGVEMIQAGLFIKNSVNKDVATSFLTDLKKDINDALLDPSLIVSGTSSLSSQDAVAVYGTSPEVAAAVTANGNGMGLGFKEAKTNKTAIDNFLSLFGVEATSEEILF